MNYDYAQVLSPMYQNQVQIFKYGKQIVQNITVLNLFELKICCTRRRRDLRKMQIEGNWFTDSTNNPLLPFSYETKDFWYRCVRVCL